MAPVRHIMLALALGASFYSGLASALGLGEVNLHSALHQPLDAEIELLQPGDLEEHEIKVQLASADVFERSGVDRFAFLTDLRFTPILRNGRSIIRVQSNRPVDEPYLNFIVEVARPNGNLLREYTLLIDPPGSPYISPSRAPAAESVATQSNAPARVSAQPATRTRPMPEASLGKHYQVQSGDSLWSISGRVLSGGGTSSREALIDDIHALNPQAFAGGDRNRLKAGAKLLLPDSASSEQGVPAAVTERGAQTAEPESAAPASAPSETRPTAEQLQASQQAADAQLSSQTEQNAQLQGAINDLQAQLAQLQEQMAEKDEQLATIKAQLEQQRDIQALTDSETATDNQAAPDTTSAAQPAPEAQPSAEPQAPAIAPLTAESSAEDSAYWSWVLGLLFFLLVLLVGVLLWKRRRPQRQVAAVAPTPVVAAATVEPELPAPVASPKAPPATVAPPTFMVAPRVPTASSDALEGANLYIAYGRFGEARSALRRAIEQEPARMELRMRLLEVLGELGDAAGFEAEWKRLEELGAGREQLEQVRSRYPTLLTPVDEPIALADVVLHLDEPTMPATESVAPEDFQLNLDDLSLDADWDLVSPFTPTPPVRGKVVSPPALDDSFRSNLSELPEVFELHVDDTLVPQVEDVEESMLFDEPLDLDLLAGNREHLVTLNMALAYIDQGDIASACNILNELINEGDDEEKARARELLSQIA